MSFQIEHIQFYVADIGTCKCIEKIRESTISAVFDSFWVVFNKNSRVIRVVRCKKNVLPCIFQ